MKLMNKKVLGLVVVMGTLLAAPAFAAGGLAKACRSDLKKFDCKAKTDAAVHECLEKNEKQGEKDEGFSHKCYVAHEAYEKKARKAEKGEEHHDESKEHKE